VLAEHTLQGRLYITGQNPNSASISRDQSDTNQKATILPKGATVLVVEDNVSNFVLIARLLGYMGIHCEWKTSGYEVVEYADSLPRLDLILMDIRLPYYKRSAHPRTLEMPA
jgi:PleD family two-component response regulator